MKKESIKNLIKLSLLIVCLLIKNTQANVLLINNNTNSPAPYNDIATAMSAANSGDTLLLTGSPYHYGNISITKTLTIIGTGVNPQKQLPYTTSVGTIGMGNNLSDVKLTGLIITGAISLAPGTTNFNLEYCYIAANQVQLNSSCVNNKISNCIFNGGGRNIDGFDACGGYYVNCNNLLIQNCIFNGTVSGLNIPGTVIQNNIFLNGSTAFNGINVYNNGGCYTTSYIYNATIQNNIFYKADPIAFTGGCAMNNNISYSPSATFSPMTGNGNLDNVDPQFVNFPAAGAPFGFTYDFHINAASPAHLAGSDGKDMGIYGGTFPCSLYGEVYNMPVIRQMNINNTNVEPNGSLNVKLRSTTSRVN